MILSEVCKTCHGSKIKAEGRWHCPACQPHTNFMYGWEGRSTYSWVRIEIPTDKVMR